MPSQSLLNGDAPFDFTNNAPQPAKGRFGQWILMLILLVALVHQPGCNPDSGSNARPDSGVSSESGQSEFSRGIFPNSENASPDFQQSAQSPFAKEILAKVIQRYKNAKNYRDQAVLHLDYRLNEKPLKEPHRFSVHWNQNQQLAARLFKTHLQSDGQLLSCYLYDIESGNLDGQQAFLPVADRLPLAQLFDDSIARHYLAGYADLPLDEQDRNKQPLLIPPPLALLTGQLNFGWIQKPEQVQRLPDQMTEGKNYYRLRSLYRQMTADIWVDSESYLLHSISMPLKMLDRQVLIAREIADVELVIRFHQAEIDYLESGDELENFRVTLKKDARPVRRFVSIPSSFPSTKIGQLVPSFQLQTSRGDSINHLSFDGKTTLLLWLPNEGNVALNQSIVKRMKTLIDESKSSGIDSKLKLATELGVEVGLVYAEADLIDPQASTLLPAPQWADLAGQLGIKLFFDQGLRTFQRFDLQGLPAIVIMGQQGKVDYVRLVSEQDVEKSGWIEDVHAALGRIARGENIAAEMHDDYQRFIDRYQQQLLSVSANDLVQQLSPSSLADRREDASPSSVNSNALSIERTPSDDRNFRLKPLLEWQIDSLRQPGNAYAFTSPGSATQHAWYLFDGWRTIVEISSHGEVQRRIPLDLPAQVAVTRIETLPASSASKTVDPHTPQFAAWGKLGRQVYLFNQHWERIDALPESGFEHEGIADVQLIPGSVRSALQFSENTENSAARRPDLNATNAKSEPVLLILFANGGGCYLFDRQQRKMELLTREPAEAMVWMQDQLTRLVFTVGDQLKQKPEWESKPSDFRGRKFLDLAFAYPLTRPLGTVDNDLPTARNRTEQASQGCRLITSFLDGQQNYYVAGVSPQGDVRWQQPVGSQLFESQIFPLAGIELSDGQLLFAIADGDRWVTLINGEGAYLGQVVARSSIQGISLAEVQGEPQLLLSQEHSVDCYRLSRSSEEMIRTSSPVGRQSGNLDQ